MMTMSKWFPHPLRARARRHLTASKARIRISQSSCPKLHNNIAISVGSAFVPPSRVPLSALVALHGPRIPRVGWNVGGGAVITSDLAMKKSATHAMSYAGACDACITGAGAMPTGSAWLFLP